jgi:hypothetical protein
VDSCARGGRAKGRTGAATKKHGLIDLGFLTEDDPTEVVAGRLTGTEAQNDPTGS